MSWDYAGMKRLLSGEAMPAALVDLDALDANITRYAAVVTGAGKRLRLATKSVRVPKLIRYIVEKGGSAFQGLMCYSAQEALLLMHEGFDDLLVAYPATQFIDLEALRVCTQAERKVTLMIDHPAHLDAISAFWKERAPELPPLNVCIDVDVSFRPFGGRAHLGVRRSPIRTLDHFQELVKKVRRSPHVRLAGVMAYEAQIAGLADQSPFATLRNPVARLIKWLSAKDVAKRRREIARWLEAQNIPIDFFNGGGSGSLAGTSREPWLTEVTAGSGFLQSHLFDYYGANRNVPAIAFALPVTRVPEPGLVTCQSGGFTASGSAGPDKLPVPFLPEGLETLATEGFGEVQTPFRVPPGVSLGVGDPVLARPAKAGEIAERFTHYVLVRGGVVIDRVATYRGLGQCFY